MPGAVAERSGAALRVAGSVPKRNKYLFGIHLAVSGPFAYVGLNVYLNVLHLRYMKIIQTLVNEDENFTPQRVSFTF